ncbi:hypothetical protein PMAYCL1PPCAC_03995, partial [Pristionchus mayeri]
ILSTINKIVFTFIRMDLNATCTPTNSRQILSGIVYLRVALIPCALNWEGKDEFFSTFLRKCSMSSSSTLLMEFNMMRTIAEHSGQALVGIHTRPVNCSHYWWTHSN